eukprot:SAG25_NODE_3941_length_923_cov_296.111650_1_plen_229_part_00
MGCRSLAALMTNHPANQTAVAAAGGIEAVVAALRAHPGAEAVQYMGCCALCLLVANHTDNTVAAVTAGVVGLVEASIERFGAWTDAYVEANNLRALLTLGQAQQRHVHHDDYDDLEREVAARSEEHEHDHLHHQELHLQVLHDLQFPDLSGGVYDEAAQTAALISSWDIGNMEDHFGDNPVFNSDDEGAEHQEMHLQVLHDLQVADLADAETAQTAALVDQWEAGQGG